ncbi:MAG TPA: MBL fold metallo-hydrolase [Kofleriaceae bacterium]|jgi:glyoxylase-like metal-dependent hydrolase (beta-lactamase superfamily II)/ferredoxin
MARPSDRIAENADGDFFVDASCIDCDLCRQLAPESFARSDRAGQSYVARQPAEARPRHRALMALVTCPTSSIGTTRKLDSKAAARAFPEQVADNVYFCGYASERSYGAASWLIVRPGGNVLVDSPRAASTLIDRVGELGGVRFMFLTHRDDVADHAKWAARFGCERVAHREDAPSGTERVIDGITELADDLHIVPVPGHTRGSCVLIDRGRNAFTGDHVWADDAGGGLAAGRDVCWYSWPEQRRSMAALAEHTFVEVFPGHGRRFRAVDAAAMQRELRRLASVMH